MPGRPSGACTNDRELRCPGTRQPWAPLAAPCVLVVTLPATGKTVTEEEEQLAAEFETHRPYLHAVAFRVLGSHADADDAVQEAWLRLARTGRGGIEDLRGWLTTVTGRICLDALRRRGTRGEQPYHGGRAAGHGHGLHGHRRRHHRDPRSDRPGPTGPDRPLLGHVTVGGAVPGHLRYAPPCTRSDTRCRWRMSKLSG
jgi:Sigma-70 region 2